MDQSPTLSLRAWLVVYALVALALTFSKLLELHSADSLIYSLGSLDHWTPFFWEQDRVGMLIPLLTSPLRNPLHNLLAQTFLMTFCGLLLPLLLVRWLFPDPVAALMAAFSNAWFLSDAPDLLHENQFIVCMYPVGLVLGLTALIVLDAGPQKWRWPLALLLMFLGMWTYLAIVVVLFPIVVLKGIVRRSSVGAIVTLLGFGVGFAMMKQMHNLPPYDVPTSNEMLPWRTWPSHWRMFLTQIAERDRGQTWLTGIAVSFVIGVLLTVVFWKRARAVVLPVALLLVMAGIEIGFCGSRKWVADNLHHPRYIIASIAALPLAASLLFVAPLMYIHRKRPPRSSYLVIMGALLMLSQAYLLYDVPFHQSPRAILDQRFGKHSKSVQDANCDAVGANYWDLWTTYFHLRMTQHGTGGHVPCPVGWRSWEYRGRWQRLSETGPFTVAIPGGLTSEVMIECVRRGLEPPTVIERHEGYDIAVTRWQQR